MPAKAEKNVSKTLIAFQGAIGAYSDMACRQVYPDMDTYPCRVFDDVFAAVENGEASLAMIPIENSVAGRVAEIHQILPHTGLHIIGEHFQRVSHQLLAPRGADIGGLKTVHSHVHALSQCRKLIADLGLEAIVHADTAGAAAEVAEKGDPTTAAIASSLAAEIYGLDILRSNIEDADHNTTRFIILSSTPVIPPFDEAPVLTSFVFHVRNVPAALYKALGGFATNGVNLLKLESYLAGGTFEAAQFYAEAEGHPEERRVQLAMEELGFYSREVKILGIYRAHPYRSRTVS